MHEALTGIQGGEERRGTGPRVAASWPASGLHHRGPCCGQATRKPLHPGPGQGAEMPGSWGLAWQEAAWPGLSHTRSGVTQDTFPADGKPARDAPTAGP